MKYLSEAELSRSTCVNFSFSFLVDIDECNTGVGTHNCSVNGTCADVDGSYDCSCNTGHTGDGFTCDSKYTSLIQL